MPALFAIFVMASVAIHPAIEIKNDKPELNKDKIKIEAVYKFNQ